MLSNKTKKYLIGQDYDLSKYNSIGTVLELDLKIIKSIKANILLYFDHTTGRIERYFVNSTSYSVFSLKKNHTLTPNKRIAYRTVNSKINIFSFLLGIYFEYIFDSKSFHLSNIEFIQNYANVLSSSNLENSLNIESKILNRKFMNFLPKFADLIPDYYNEDLYVDFPYYKTNQNNRILKFLFTPFVPHNFYSFNPNLPNFINYPIIAYDTQTNKIYKTLGFKIKYYYAPDLPPILKDIKKELRTITDVSQIDLLIAQINSSNKNKLQNLRNPLFITKMN